VEKKAPAEAKILERVQSIPDLPVTGDIGVEDLESYVKLAEDMSKGGLPHQDVSKGGQGTWDKQEAPAEGLAQQGIWDKQEVSPKRGFSQQGVDKDILQQLREMIGDSDDPENEEILTPLVEFVTTMLKEKYSRETMETELTAFLGDSSSDFVKWLEGRLSVEKKAPRPGTSGYRSKFLRKKEMMEKDDSDLDGEKAAEPTTISFWTW